jgi:hypothetical protein
VLVHQVEITHQFTFSPKLDMSPRSLANAITIRVFRAFGEADIVERERHLKKLPLERVKDFKYPR